MEIKKITREDEAAIPRFRSHREARMWFTIKYGDAFQIEESFMVGEGDGATVCYRYALILDEEAYHDGIHQLTRGSMSDARSFLDSYQSIEIMLDGDVHVIH